MSERLLTFKKAIPVVVVTWILSLLTTLAIVYYAPEIFPPLNTENIVDYAILTTKLADGSVTSSKILDGTVTAFDIADGSITTIKVADGAVTTSKIADGATTSGKIADNAIVTVKLANGAVTSAKILDGTITTQDLADGSVNYAKIADGSVTTTKIADGSVTNAKLGNNAIPHNILGSEGYSLTTSTTWTDVNPNFPLQITVERKSTILILFGVEARNTDPAQQILIRALVDGYVTFPSDVYLTPTVSESTLHSHTLGYTAHSYVFWRDVLPGTHGVTIQWRVTGGTGESYGYNLFILAIPTYFTG